MLENSDDDLDDENSDNYADELSDGWIIQPFMNGAPDIFHDFTLRVAEGVPQAASCTRSSHYLPVLT